MAVGGSSDSGRAAASGWIRAFPQTRFPNFDLRRLSAVLERRLYSPAHHTRCKKSLRRRTPVFPKLFLWRGALKCTP